MRHPLFSQRRRSRDKGHAKYGLRILPLRQFLSCKVKKFSLYRGHGGATNLRVGVRKNAACKQTEFVCKNLHPHFNCDIWATSQTMQGLEIQFKCLNPMSQSPIRCRLSLYPTGLYWYSTATHPSTPLFTCRPNFRS